MQKNSKLKLINILLIVFAIITIIFETLQIVGLIQGWIDSYWNLISTTLLIISNFISLLAIRILIKRNEQ